VQGVYKTKWPAVEERRSEGQSTGLTVLKHVPKLKLKKRRAGRGCRSSRRPDSSSSKSNRAQGTKRSVVNRTEGIDDEDGRMPETELVRYAQVKVDGVLLRGERRELLSSTGTGEVVTDQSTLPTAQSSPSLGPGRDKWRRS
jgi:hypothetical protein